ncbi:MAG: RHS repeat-associated core domain-containing protein [Caulobacteraceae bacterium]|nr:RHS repeat-associated core domain-containing protein [Caulobacteraceae bacterium]
MTARRWIAALSVCASMWACATAGARAQEIKPLPPPTALTLPSMKFVTGAPISPTDAETHYATATLHTDSLATVKKDGVPQFGADAPEIVELAAALKHDPDLIFEYVRNQIDTEFAFGLRKGALGALIDKSGTPFDQNALFVALVRQNGGVARYQVGRLTLRQAAFTAWTGVSDIQAACRVLTSGGIPAVFNNASAAPARCSDLTAAFTKVTLLHIWSQVLINGTWYSYDPSYKAYAGPTPVDLAAASGVNAADALGAVTGGLESGTDGAPYIRKANQPALGAYLTARGSQLLAWLKANAASSDIPAVAGLTKIQLLYEPAGGWRSADPPGYAVTGYSSIADLAITGDIPDQYRTRLQVLMSAAVNDFDQQTVLGWNFFVDDIDGRRIGIDTNFDAAHNINPNNYTKQSESLVVDDVVVKNFNCDVDNSTCFQGGVPGQVTLSVIHPYAAGAFADQTVVKPLSAVTAPVAIVAGFGRVSPARLAKWSDEVASDKALPFGGSQPWRCDNGTAWCKEHAPQSAGDLTRQKLAASWLAQMSRMLALQTAIGGTTAEHHHSIGIVDWRHKLQEFRFPPQPPTNPLFYTITDEFTDLNIDSVLSVTSKTGNAPTVAAVSRSVALASATLEGSVLEQMEDLPDTASTAARFAWGNQPDDEDPCFTTNHPRRFYDYTGTTSTTRTGLFTYEGSAHGCNARPLIVGDVEDVPGLFILNADSAVAGYVGAGFAVTGSSETFLGPGARFGPAHSAVILPYNDPSQQRGAAFIATRWDNAMNPTTVLEVAHTLTSLSGLSKGGGGKQPERFAEYDPAKAADALKDRFVDRSVALGVDLKTGTVGYTTPTLLSVGAGSLPYRLDVSLAYKAGAGGGCFGPCTGPVQGGWDHNWDVRFSNSGSGLEAMGATSPFPAAGTLVAFLAMQGLFQRANLADLNKDVFAALAADWWRAQMVANVATVSRGFSGAQYVRQVDGMWAPPIGSPGLLTQSGYRVKARDACFELPGNAYPFATARRWDHSQVSFSLRNAGGDVLAVQPWTWNYDPSNTCAIVYGYKPVSWTWPQGPSLSFTYDYSQGVVGIATSLGRSMTFTGARSFAGPTASAGGLTAGQADDQGHAVRDAASETWTFALTPIMDRSSVPTQPGQRPVPYQQLQQVFEPVNSTQPALQYGYDRRGLVNSASDAVALQWKTHGPYAWLITLGGRGERDDPNGGAYTVYYDVDGNSVRNIDELGREVTSAWDGRRRVVSRTYPETDQDQFAYDASDNVVKLTKVAKAGSGLANLVVGATYEPTWNHLASITDPMGNKTNFTYYPNSGVCGTTGASPSMMCRAQRPAAGGVRPTFTYQYNAIGLPTRSVDPTGVTTGHGYNNLGDLISTTEGAAAVGSNPALNLTTVFAPDPVGNVAIVTDPRGNATTTQYDAMRRKAGEQNRDGGAGALPLMAKAFVYDPNGRLIEEDRATSFDAGGGVTGWQAWLTAYTPTGKVAITTDPLGNETRTLYDALDRPSQVTDASGRVTGKTYDLAGQELTEVRGIGTPLQQNTATYSWWPDGQKRAVIDANANRIGLAYDSFNRLAAITHPDNTTELSAYDPDGDLTIWTNRGGYSIVRCYDVLNRKVSEEGRTGATNTGACPTGGTVNLVARPWDIPPRTFAYDLAGRLIDAAIPNFDLAWAYDAAGRPTGRGGSWSTHYGWDSAGNMTGVTYTDGSSFTYQYDALNRTTAALQGSTALAGLGYDPLGRRTTLLFGDGSTQIYGFDGADRLVRLDHAFPTTSTDNLTLGYGYDPAGRELTRTASNGAYAYSPPTASTAYGAANARNQYPSVNGYPYTWWPEGPLMQDDKRLGQYNELGKLTKPLITLAPGVVDPDNWDSMAVDALDHVYAHSHQSVAGQTYPFIYHSTDGLRPENVVEWQFVGLNGGPTTQQGIRRYVLGPGPDERWAFLDFDAANSIYYPHADRDGTTIALSKAGSAPTKFRYGPYGESGDAITDTGPGSASYPYRYTGQRLDPNTGLYDYKARDYSPALGRFLQTDPAGLDQGPNLYEYVGNDPVNASDPDGMTECPTGSRLCSASGTSASTVSISFGAGHGAGVHQNSQNTVTEQAVAHHDARMCQGESSCEKAVFDQGKADANRMMQPIGLTAVAGIFGPLLLLPALPAAAPYEAVGLGTGDVAAADAPGNMLSLRRDLAIQEARNNPSAARIMQGKIVDPRYPEARWGKFQHTHRGSNSGDITVHFWRDLLTGIEEGFKIK